MRLTVADEVVEHLVEHFDRAAPEYDGWAGGLHAKVARRLAELVDPRPGQACLDVGTGTGLVAHALADKVGSKGSVVAIDLSPVMLDVARARPRPAKAPPNLTFLAMAAERMVFRPASFDIVTYGQSLPYLEDPEASLEEAVRLLKPGGRLGLSVHNRAYHTDAQELFYGTLGPLAERHHLSIPRHSTDRAAMADKETLAATLARYGLADVQITEMITGGRASTPRQWTELMAGTGTLPHTLIKVLGDKPRAAYEAELAEAMEDLGDDAFRYHFSYVFARGTAPPAPTGRRARGGGQQRSADPRR